MAIKKFRAAQVAKKSPRRSPIAPSAKPSLTAHPRLIYGFLVRLGAASTAGAGRAKRASAAEAKVKARAQRASDTKHEGPADDATFH